jgi:alpha-ketoglutarate-dependent taurine dioxygenase
VTVADHDIDLDVRLLSGTIGAEIRGLDLRAVSDDAVANIRSVWLARKVVFFPDQNLAPDTHMAFASRFGELTEAHPVLPPMAEHPHIHQIDYAEQRDVMGPAPRDRGLDWHTDVTFMARPPMATILRVVTVPEAGGDTMWSDQVAAFEGLSPTMQTFVSSLTAVHDARSAFSATLEKEGGGHWDGEEITELVPVRHPVVRTHPETGTRSLYVNSMFTSHIAELDPAESAVLLRFLYQHSVRPVYTVRHHWRAGDVAMWDNRSTQHAVVGDFGTQDRVIQRVTLRGDEPR